VSIYTHRAKMTNCPFLCYLTAPQFVEKTDALLRLTLHEYPYMENMRVISINERVVL